MANQIETNVNLKINRVPDKTTLEDMVANNQIKPNQLYMLPSELGSGVVTMQTKVLWENSSPTSSFAEQSVSLSDIITDYDYFLVEYKLETSSTNFYVQLMKEICQLTYLNRAYSFYGSRNISIDVANNKFSVSNAYYGSSASLNNGMFIPTQIIGIKLIESPTQITNKYSTEETVVGEWIDGKKIYRKVFELSSMITISNSSWTSSTISKTANNIETVINARGWNDSNTMFIYNVAVNINDYVNLIVARDGSTGSVIKIMLEYTKTTD